MAVLPASIKKTVVLDCDRKSEVAQIGELQRFLDNTLSCYPLELCKRRRHGIKAR